MERFIEIANKEKVETLSFPQQIFGPVFRHVCHFALKKAHEAYQKVVTQFGNRSCSQRSKAVFGLLCSHLITSLFHLNSPLRLEYFDPHWRKDPPPPIDIVTGVLEPLRVENLRGRLNTHAQSEPPNEILPHSRSMPASREIGNATA